MPALTTPPHKRKLLLEHGVDAVLLLEFNERLRKLSAADFVADCIVGSMNARALLVGFNTHTHGKDGEGTFEVLKAIGEKHNLKVIEAERIEVSGHAMSFPQPSASTCRTAIFTGRARCWAGPTVSWAWSRAATRADARSAFPPPTSRSWPIRRAVFGVRVWLDGQAHLQRQHWRAPHGGQSARAAAAGSAPARFQRRSLRARDRGRVPVWRSRRAPLTRCRRSRNNWPQMWPKSANVPSNEHGVRKQAAGARQEPADACRLLPDALPHRRYKHANNGHRSRHA